MKNVFAKVGLMSATTLLALTACTDEQQFTDYNTQSQKIEVQKLDEAHPDMAKVRDYVPLYAVIAHRGSTFWAPEETEASWRWARDMGADYLESDLQTTKDGVVLALHDDNLKRTTNIQSVFSDQVPAFRVQFYENLCYEDGTPCGFTHDECVEQYIKDQGYNYYGYYPRNYYYAELLMLDAGSWFNIDTPERARAEFAATNNAVEETLASLRLGGDVVYSNGLYISALADQIAYAEGKMLNRDSEGRRILPYYVPNKYKGMSLAELADVEMTTDINGNTYGSQAKYMDFIKYDFSNAYVKDPQDSGNRPGIYIELKESWAQSKNIEALVYNELDKWDWNIITDPAATYNQPFYKDGKVNIGKTMGKVILQTFSFDSVERAYNVFKGRIPMCYLLWTDFPGDYATDIKYDTPAGVADCIKYMQDKGCHIIGPAISGAPNNYPEMNCPWQAYMVRKAGMINHPYSFDSQAQITKYMGYWIQDWFKDEGHHEFPEMDVTIPATSYSKGGTFPVYMDGCFTNRTEMNLEYMINYGMRCNAHLPNPFHPGQEFDNSQAPSEVPNAQELLTKLGYHLSK